MASSAPTEKQIRAALFALGDVKPSGRVDLHFKLAALLNVPCSTIDNWYYKNHKADATAMFDAAKLAGRMDKNGVVDKDQLPRGIPRAKRGTPATTRAAPKGRKRTAMNDTDADLDGPDHKRVKKEESDGDEDLVD